MESSLRKKILIADASEKLKKMIYNSDLIKNYDFLFVSDGIEYKKEIESINPDLIIVELLLPRNHGIDLLKWTKSHDKLKSKGFIITTYELIQQNHRAAYEFGADFFLEKPFNIKDLTLILSSYFSKTLKKEPYSGHKSIDYAVDSYYDPKYEYPKNYIKFWGTRGSSSVSGSEYSKFGGNTSCIEIRYGKDLIIFDSGSGIRKLGDTISKETIKTINLFISHTHQDHVVGFPFFLPLYLDRTTLNIYSPIGYEKKTKELFTDMLAYSFFPVRLEQMQAQVKFLDIHDGDTVKIGDLSITSFYTYHPGSTLGFKIKTPKQTIAYITDNEFLVGFHGHPNEINENHISLDNHRHLINYLQDCDLIIHEAQYFPKEYLQRVGWGHSSIVNASILFKFTPCNEWIVTHHDPRHTDEDLNIKIELHKKILQESDLKIHLRYAYDEMIIPLN